MPDSFQSWFLSAHLNVWLCMVRLKREGKDGNYLTKQIVSMFWYDVEQRIKELGVSYKLLSDYCVCSSQRSPFYKCNSLRTL